ncbi:MAG: CsiV family protein, partial [Shewanella sp.]
FLQSIPLIQNRRVRSGELHYFDHPQLGIVMQIRKMAQPTSVKPIDLTGYTPQGQPMPYSS